MARFDPTECARMIEAEKATVFAEFAPMLTNLLDKAAETETPLSSLRAVFGLDTAETIERFEKMCPDALFWASYGQSETSGPVTLSLWSERPGSTGRPMPLNAVAVVDDLDQPIGTGQVGEIVVRGPIVFCGYGVAKTTRSRSATAGTIPETWVASTLTAICSTPAARPPRS
jgi:acyl-CoA synthetase (AMP-forming)/AMP-acid ligase II